MTDNNVIFFVMNDQLFSQPLTERDTDLRKFTLIDNFSPKFENFFCKCAHQCKM